MNTLTLQSPAKLNLYLKILGRYPNGYHELATLFHRISLSDTLYLRKRAEGFSLRCSHPELLCGHSNLITKAYRLLQSKFPKLGGVSVRLIKRIPLAAGLGGGSSNAAFFLLGMNRLYGLSLSRRNLADLGSRLGADVPFFIYETPQAVGRGIGDKIQPKPLRLKLYFVLVVSDRGLSTRRVYEGLKPAVSLTKVTRVITMRSGKLARRDGVGLSRLLHNDLAPSAFRLRPSILKTISKFHRLGIPSAGMSGSGPTVFAVVSNLREAEDLARKIRRKEPGKRIFVCHSH